MKVVFSKSGRRLVGRLAELYTGDCPPERPCTQEQVAEHRKLLDGAAPNVVDFAIAMKREMAWRAQDGAAPTPEERQQRRNICNGCELRDPANDSCKICGCYLEAGLLPPRLLGKIDCATERCPQGFWEYTGGYVPAEKDCCGKKE